MTARRQRPLLHVRIADNDGGALLADVDAQSTADGLAYYLSSRRIVPDATEASVWAGAAPLDPFDPAVRLMFVRTEWDGSRSLELIAEVH